MSDNNSRIAEFERYISWRLESNSNLIQSTDFTENSVHFKVRIFSEDTEEINVMNFTFLTDFLRFAEETFFVVQNFVDQNGFNFGKITFWDSPEIPFQVANENFTVKKLLLLEFGFENDFQYELVFAI